MANIEFSKVINPTTDTTLYGHQAYDQAGFPMNAGNFKLSTIMDMFLNTQDDEIKAHFEFVEGLDRNYTLNYKGVAVASLKLPPDRFLKEARFNPESKILSLTFATDSTDQVVDIDFSALIDVYSAGNGLQLSDATFSLKLQTGEARLKLSPSGLFLDLSDITKKIDDEASIRLNADNGLSLRIETLEDSWTSNLQTIQEASRIATNAATQASADAKTALDGATAATGAAERSSVHEANAEVAKRRAMEWASKETGAVEGSLLSAKQYAENAQSSASSASASATSANGSASTASTKASEASTSASNAKASETASKTSETNALKHSQSASNSATSASSSASTASTKASEASTSASTASAKASEAGTSASKAKTSEINAKASEENASTAATNAQNAEKKALEYKNAINPSQFVTKTSVTQGQYTIPGGFNGSLS